MSTAGSQTQNVTLNVRGMTCGSCQRHVAEALKSVDGVTNVEVDLKNGLANVAFEPATASVSAMIEAVRESGYEAA